MSITDERFYPPRLVTRISEGLVVTSVTLLASKKTAVLWIPNGLLPFIIFSLAMLAAGGICKFGEIQSFLSPDLSNLLSLDLLNLLSLRAFRKNELRRGPTDFHGLSLATPDQECCLREG